MTKRKRGLRKETEVEALKDTVDLTIEEEDIEMTVDDSKVGETEITIEMKEKTVEKANQRIRQKRILTTEEMKMLPTRKM